NWKTLRRSNHDPHPLATYPCLCPPVLPDHWRWAKHHSRNTSAIGRYSWLAPRSGISGFVCPVTPDTRPKIPAGHAGGLESSGLGRRLGGIDRHFSAFSGADLLSGHHLEAL